MKIKLLILTLLLGVVSWGQITESFESGLPGAYNSTLSNATLGTGIWQVKDVIAGTTGVNIGTKSAQIRNLTAAQIITPTLSGGVGIISFYVTGSTASGAYQVNVSTDDGFSWTAATGSPFTIGTTMTFRSITINNSSVNKIQIYRTGATIYIDDFETTAYSSGNTVTFNSNYGTPTTTTQTSASAAALTANSFTRTGYDFANWHTTTSGTGGTSYADGATYPFTANATLYAQWTIKQYTVSYNGNGNTGGTAPATQTSDYNSGIVLATNSGGLTKTGFAFTGWNTLADGLGTHYDVGDSFTIPASNTPLFAEWQSTSPFVTTSGTLAGVNTTYGTASANTSFTVSAGNLSANLIVTAPAGFEISLTAGSGFATFLNLGSGARTNTPIYVRLAATTAVGSYNGTISLVSGATSTTKATATSVVTAKALTISGLSASNKVFDRFTTVAITGIPAYVGLANGETFSVTGTVSWAFADYNVGTSKPITRTGNYNAPSSNYTVTQPTLTANITAKPVTATGATAQNKPYDGTTTATITGATLVGIIAPDAITVSGGGAFASANVGTGISVTAALTLAGTGSGNYSLTQPTGLTATITAVAPTFTTSTINLSIAGTYTLPGANVLSNSAGALSYTITSGGNATLAGTTITGVSAGTETLTVNQAANGNYTAGSTTVTMSVSACTPPIWEENFDYGSCDNVNLPNLTSNWIKFSGSDNDAQYRNSSLTYGSYPSSGIGGSFSFETGGSDDIRREFSASGINSGNVYASFLINMNSTTSTADDYFLSLLGDFGAITPHGKIYVKKEGTQFRLGVGKQSSSGSAADANTSLLNFGQTYLVIVKYEFIVGGVNDPFKLWVISSGVPASEAAAGSFITATLSGTDATNLKSFAIRQTNKPKGFVDGIRVATSWESLFCATTPTATSYTWTGASSSAWSDAANWSPNKIPSSLDNIIINTPGTNVLNITDCRTVKNFTLNGTGTFTASALGELTINGDIVYGGTANAVLNCNSKVFIKSASSQPIPPLTYGNLNVLGGPRVFPNGGTIKICNVFDVVPDPSTSIYTVTNSTVEYISADTGWIMTPFTYNNLTFSGTGSFSLGYSSPEVNKTVTVLGNYMQTAGSLFLGETATKTATLNIDGNMTISGGNFDVNKTLGGTGIINLKGDLNVANAAQLTSTYLGGKINFTGTGDGSTDALTQTIDIKNLNSVYYTALSVESGFTQLINQDLYLGTNSSFEVKNGARFNFGFAADGVTPLHIVRVNTPTLRNGQTFTAQAGSTLKITSPDGISNGASVYTGNVQIGSSSTNRVFDPAAIFHYIGKANQVTGNGLPIAASNKHVIVELAADNFEFTSNNGIVRFNNPASAIGANFKGFEIRKGTVIADDIGNRFEDSTITGEEGNLKMTGGIYKIFTKDSQPAVSGIYDLSGGSKIIFAHTAVAATTQAIRGGASYQYPQIEVEGKDVRYSNVGINMKSNGLFTVKENAILTNTGTVGQIVSVDNANPATLTVKNTAIFKTEKEKGFNGAPDGINPSPSVRTNHTSGNVNVVLEPGSTVEYSRAGDQTITLFSPYYANVKISGTGIKTLGSLNQLAVNENLNVKSSKLLLNVNEVITVKQAVLIDDALATMELKNNAQLIQIDDIDANFGTKFTTIRDYTASNLDYVYWSAPTKLFSSALLPNGARYGWNPVYPNTNGTFGNWIAPEPLMVAGKGYIARTLNGFSTPTTLPFSFTGQPNNGIIQVPIQRENIQGLPTDPPLTYPIVGSAIKWDDNWNLVGNPYPSAINVLEFLSNGANADIEGFVHVWTHNTPPSDAIADPFYDNFVINYTSDDYVVYNGLGTVEGPTGFNGNIASGQAFFVMMVDGPAASSTISFKNSMRRDDVANTVYNNSQFYRNASGAASIEGDRNRIWLDIISAQNKIKRMLVGYVETATNEKDRIFDALTTPENMELYSFLDETDTQEYCIQGRALPFVATDKVKLGINIPVAGAYKIAIGAVDGLFTESQPIYLEDKLLEVIYDLRAAPYDFISVDGKFDDRFVLRYTSSNLGGSDFDMTNAVIVTTNQNMINITAQSENINHVQVFDMLGRQLYSNNTLNTLSHSIANIARNQALIIKIKLNNGSLISKKIIVK